MKPGDASMASPFTAKAASVLPCVDILKQGRCTLVTTVQVRTAQYRTAACGLPSRQRPAPCSAGLPAYMLLHMASHCHCPNKQACSP